MSTRDETDIQKLQADMREVKSDISLIKGCLKKIEEALMGSLDHPDAPGLLPDHCRRKKEFDEFKGRVNNNEEQISALAKSLDKFKNIAIGLQISFGIVIAIGGILIKFYK